MTIESERHAREVDAAKSVASTCCVPARPETSKVHVPNLIGGARRVSTDAVEIPGGSSLIGTKNAQIPDDGEAPLRKHKVRPFLMAATTVTNSDFSKFIQATGYVTDADRFGWSFVFWSDLPEHFENTQAVQGVEWWRKVEGARWDRIDGRKKAPDDHPVVHVSWNDAQAYSHWVGGRLPTEAEWEHAARGGLGDVRFPWGDQEPDEASFFPCNIWQGQFPHVNEALDGYLATSPARSFEPNKSGLYNMVGNVWEWTAEPYRVRSLKKQVRERLAKLRGFKLLKGGSFLCHRSYCYRYRIAARSGNSVESTTSHQGFRVVWDKIN